MNAKLERFCLIYIHVYIYIYYSLQEKANVEVFLRLAGKTEKHMTHADIIFHVRQSISKNHTNNMVQYTLQYDKYNTI